MIIWHAYIFPQNKVLIYDNICCSLLILSFLAMLAPLWLWWFLTASSFLTLMATPPSSFLTMQAPSTFLLSDFDVCASSSFFLILIVTPSYSFLTFIMATPCSSFLTLMAANFLLLSGCRGFSVFSFLAFL